MGFIPEFIPEREIKQPNSRENLGDGPGDKGSWSPGSSGSISDIRFVISDPKNPRVATMS
ncbi:hypothetical protein NQ318_009752 [Aromia moschata]|uniref:Uncharacterized protein n=1 Tax=Aromia moschata TaxID=1265417 RepID=A0AAV8Y911_9CUCU|nr:hypothetical protein NQ318_009752 [Aromia moschata]